MEDMIETPFLLKPVKYRKVKPEQYRSEAVLHTLDIMDITDDYTEDGYLLTFTTMRDDIFGLVKIVTGEVILVQYSNFKFV